MQEASARIIIDKLLRESGWVLPGDDGKVNVETETRNDAGFADYTLFDSKGSYLCIIEAKRELKSPLDGKEQARGSEYFNSLEFAVVATTVPIEVRFSLTMNELGEVIIGTTASTPPPPQAFRKIIDIINNCLPNMLIRSIPR